MTIQTEQMKAITGQLDEKPGTAITGDYTKLQVGAEYIIETIDPDCRFDVGRLVGFRFWSDGPQDVETFVTELPEDWDQHYPDAIFERAVVAEHYMVTFWPKEPE